MKKAIILPILEVNKCSQCGGCVTACPSQALGLLPNEEGPYFRDEAACTYCTTCEEVCPEQAIHCPFTINWA